MIYLLVLLLLSINEPVNTQCPGCVSMKTYQLSSDLNPNCTNNCPYQFGISIMNFAPGKEAKFHLNIMAKNIDQSKNIDLATQIFISGYSNNYRCDKTGSKMKTKVEKHDLILNEGTSSYNPASKTLTCTWNIEYPQKSWPSFNASLKANLQRSANYEIYFYLEDENNTKKIPVDLKPRELTMDSKHYLECCGLSNILDKDTNYDLWFKKDDKNLYHFVFLFYQNKPNMLKTLINLKSHNFTFVCHFDSKNVSGSVTMKGASYPLDKSSLTSGQIIDFGCKWTLNGSAKMPALRSRAVPLKDFDWSDIKHFKIWVDEKVIYELKAPPPTQKPGITTNSTMKPTLTNSTSTMSPVTTKPSLAKSGVTFIESSFPSILISFIISQFLLLFSNKI